MPKMTDEQRQKWESHRKHSDDFWARLEAKYHTKEKRSAQCRLCGEYVTAVDPIDVYDVLREHEHAHPEYDEWTELSREFSLTDLPGVLHDHDCVFVKCACQCGCQASICVAEVAPEKRGEPRLCELCELYQGRGHVEHRLDGE